MKFRSIAYLAALTALCLSVGSCKSSEGGDGPNDDVLTVLETVPEDGSTEIPVATGIGFQLSQPIDPDSLTSDTVLLTDEDGNVIPSTVDLGPTEDVAEITPDEPLSVITNFRVTVTTGVASTGGATLDEDFSWNFRTVDSEWGESAWLEELATGTSDRVEIVTDAQLNAFAVWEYETGDGTAIWANRYTRRDLWAAPIQIDPGTGSAARPAIAADALGNGFAVWDQSEVGSSVTTIWTNRYSVEQGAWGTPEQLQSDALVRSRLADVDADPEGNATAIWVEEDPETGFEILIGVRFDADSGSWGEPEAIVESNPASVLVGTTVLGMDDEGNAVAVWSRSTGVGDIILSSQYQDGVGWSVPELIKADLSTDARGIRLSVGNSGDAFVIWTQSDDIRDDIWAVRWSGSAWAAPERIDTYDADDKATPDVAVDGNGVAHAVWAQADEQFVNIWSSEYSTSSGWGAPELIEPANENPLDDGDAANPRVDTNSAGNTFVVWRQPWRGWRSVWSNRLDPGTGWMTAERIEAIDENARLPIVAVDENRHAHAVWLHGLNSSVDWVRTNRFE